MGLGSPSAIDEQFEQMDEADHMQMIAEYREHALRYPNELWGNNTKACRMRQLIVDAGIRLRRRNPTRFSTNEEYAAFLAGQLKDLKNNAGQASAGEIARDVFAPSTTPAWTTPIHIRSYPDQEIRELLTRFPAGEGKSFF